MTVGLDDRRPPRWEWAVDRLIGAGRLGAELSLVAMMVLITLEVICRSFLGFSLTIVDETCGYLVVALLFLGMSYSLREQALLRVEFIINALPSRARAWIELLFDVASLGFAVVILYQMGRLAISSWQRGMVAPTLMETPIYLPQLVMPVGALLLLLGLLAEIARDVHVLAGGAPRVSS
ncbi:TRAP-type C4-dicarboxylate transport system permease small subunit [Stella humosa]|uniref:TRAP transporter small permease protein n=1 Tax=Stella humosa TaxID=94 RepID=A0A3N1L0K1_9PROT|nr:TRAP transporter small permease [Stella humosa]ROP84470.1 TRAP-type C4-dicarboxylate transport system permease small subunit [Stella humosa]BBK33989.1 membrane protein [Stella humosa]